MSKRTFKEYICRPYCMFYKGESNEAMVCRGAVLASLLMDKKNISVAGLPALRKEPSLWTAYRRELEQRVCRHCAFRAADCDFQSAEPPPDTEPCGGFILLAHLRTCGLLNEADLEETT